MSKSIGRSHFKFMTASELFELSNMQIVDERKLRKPDRPCIEQYTMKDVLFKITPGEQEFTADVLEKLLGYVKDGCAIEPEYSYDECTLVVYSKSYTHHSAFAEATERFYKESTKYDSIIAENKKNRETKDRIITKAKERIQSIMSNKEYREKFEFLNREYQESLTNMNNDYQKQIALSHAKVSHAKDKMLGGFA